MALQLALEPALQPLDRWANNCDGSELLGCRKIGVHFVERYEPCFEGEGGEETDSGTVPPIEEEMRLLRRSNPVVTESIERHSLVT